MNKKWIIFIAPVLFGAGLWIGSTIITSNADGLIASNQPGSVDDPIVTKSYVDQQVQQVVKAELSKQTVNKDKIKQLIEEATKTSKQASADMTVVQLKAGQLLYAGAGTEFIVRTGKSVAFSNDGNGIPDVTAGKDIPNGATIELNHMLLFPREGRGIKPDPKSNGSVTVMVRGKYLQINEDGSKVNP